MNVVNVPDPTVPAVVDADWDATSIALAIPDPTIEAVVHVDWDTGITKVDTPSAVVHIPIAVGIPGRDGAAGDSTITHVETVPQLQFVYTHSFGRYANVTVRDTTGRLFDADVQEMPVGVVSVTFVQPTACTITLS